MKFLRVTLTVLFILLLVYALVNAFIPASFKVERYVFVNISEKKLYNYLRNADHIEAWNPWVESDEGSWERFGNMGELESGIIIRELPNDVGSLRMELAYFKPTHDIRYKFTSESHESVESLYFRIKRQENEETRVTVGIRGRRSFPFRIFNLMMDKQAAPDLEKILNQIWAKNRADYLE